MNLSVETLRDSHTNNTLSGRGYFNGQICTYMYKPNQRTSLLLVGVWPHMEEISVQSKDLLVVIKDKFDL